MSDKTESKSVPDQPQAEREPMYDDLDLELEPHTDTEVFGGMLNGIMANYFEYEHGDGTTLNLAETLLLIRQSIDQNTEAIKELAAATKAKGA